MFCERGEAKKCLNAMSSPGFGGYWVMVDCIDT